MQVTETQVQRSLAALTDSERFEGDAPPLDNDVDGVPVGLVERLSGSPAIRDDRLEEARRRLDAGELPTDEDLAHRMVGRLVCDRLR